MYYCDPAWHKGDRAFPARFFIRQAAPADGGPMAPAFAACETHAGQAITVMMIRYGWSAVLVRDVSGRAEAAAERAAAEAEG